MSSYYIIFMIRKFAVTRIICVTNIIQWCLLITSHIIWSVKNERCGLMKIKTRTGGNNRGGWFTFDNDLNTIVGCDNNGSNHFIYLLFFMNILFIYLVAHIYIYIYILHLIYYWSYHFPTFLIEKVESPSDLLQLWDWLMGLLILLLTLN